MTRWATSSEIRCAASCNVSQGTGAFGASAPSSSRSRTEFVIRSGPFNKLKQFRRIATRYEKLAANYLAMIKIATIRIWLRANESTA